MIANKIAFFIAVVLAAQVSSRTVHDVHQYKGVIDIAQKALEKLTKVVEAVVNSAHAAIEGMKRSVINLKDKLVASASSQAQKIEDQFFEGLDEFKQRANEAGVNIIECTEGKEDEVRQLHTQTLDNTGVCLTDTVTSVLNSLSEVVEDVQSTNDELSQLGDELGECKTSEHEFACVTEVIAKIVNATSELPDKIREDIRRAGEQVDTVPNELKVCLQDNYDAFSSNASKLFNDIAQCIENKLSPSSTVPSSSEPSSTTAVY